MFLILKSLMLALLCSSCLAAETTSAIIEVPVEITLRPGAVGAAPVIENVQLAAPGAKLGLVPTPAAPAPPRRAAAVAPKPPVPSRPAPAAPVPKPVPPPAARPAQPPSPAKAPPAKFAPEPPSPKPTPKPAPPSPKPAPKPVPPAPLCRPLIDALRASGSTSTFASLLDQTGLTHSLLGLDDAGTHITLLAPTDAAFAALLKTLNTSLSELERASPVPLRKVLLYHVLPKPVRLADSVGAVLRTELYSSPSSLVRPSSVLPRAALTGAPEGGSAVLRQIHPPGTKRTIGALSRMD